jgi:hypothetical protein
LQKSECEGFFYLIFSFDALFGSLPTLAKIKMSLIQSSFFHKNAFDAIESNLPAFLIVVALYVQSFAHIVAFTSIHIKVLNCEFKDNFQIK